MDPASQEVLSFDVTTHEVYELSERTNRDQAIGIEIIPFSIKDAFKSREMSLALDYGSIKYRNDNARKDSFSYYDLDTQYTWKPFLRTAVVGMLGLKSRSFQKSDDHRTDLGIDLKGRWDFYYLPSMMQTFSLEYDINQSKRKTFDYQRYCAELGYVFSF